MNELNESTQKPASLTQTVKPNPGCLIAVLWFIFVGWWLGGLAILVAWLLNVTIIGLPVGLYILNNIPMLLFLNPPGKQFKVQGGSGGLILDEKGLPQVNLLVRSLYFLLIGWWFSLIWSVVAYIFCATLVLMPLGMLMLNWLPAVTTLKRY
jgi:uncharacterized membrane protein YccF (DUF307 family)